MREIFQTNMLLILLLRTFLLTIVNEPEKSMKKFSWQGKNCTWRLQIVVTKFYCSLLRLQKTLSGGLFVNSTIIALLYGFQMAGNSKSEPQAWEPLIQIGCLTFNEWCEEGDVGSFSSTRWKGQPDPVQLVSQKFPAVFWLGSVKENRKKLEKLKWPDTSSHTEVSKKVFIMIIHR